MLSILPKLDSSIKIFFSKIDKSIFYMIPKATFAKKIDNNNNIFELASHNYIYNANRFFAKNNNIQKSVIS